MHCKSLWIKASAKCINVNDAAEKRWAEETRMNSEEEQEVEQSNMEHLHPQVCVLTSGRFEFFIQAACQYLQTRFKPYSAAIMCH